MQVEDEGEIQHLGMNKYISLVFCISNRYSHLGTVSCTSRPISKSTQATIKCHMKVKESSNYTADFKKNKHKTAKLYACEYTEAHVQFAI